MRKPGALLLDFSAEGKANLTSARAWLRSFSPEASQRFSTKAVQELGKLCRQYAAVPPPHPMNEAASIFYARPVFGHRFQTGKTTRKRSASGVWYVFFDLRDMDGDGRPDMLRVLSIRHASAPLLWEESRDDDEGEEA